MNDLAYTILVFAAAVGGGAVLGFIAGHYAGYSDATRAYGGWPKREAAPGAHVPHVAGDGCYRDPKMAPPKGWSEA